MINSNSQHHGPDQIGHLVDQNGCGRPASSSGWARYSKNSTWRAHDVDRGVVVVEETGGGDDTDRIACSDRGGLTFLATFWVHVRYRACR
jgi:hypothetical protein